MREHRIRTLPAFFEATIEGVKTFVIAINDRGYQTGDTLILEEHEQAPGGVAGSFTGRECYCDIVYVLNGWGVRDGFLAMGISNIRYIDRSEETEKNKIEEREERAKKDMLN